MPKEHRQQLLAPEEPGNMAVQDAQGVLSSHLLLCIETSITQHWNFSTFATKIEQPWWFASIVNLPPFIPQNIISALRSAWQRIHDEASSFSKATSGSKAPAYLKAWNKWTMSMHLESSMELKQSSFGTFFLRRKTNDISAMIMQWYFKYSSRLVAGSSTMSFWLFALPAAWVNHSVIVWVEWIYWWP